MRYLEMRRGGPGRAMRSIAAFATVVLTLALTLGVARAQDKTYTMKISLATINDQIHALAKNFAAAVDRNSGGRIKTKFIRRANWARFHGKPKACSSARSSVRSFRRSFWSGSMSASR